jgi:hypothetical protein
MAPRLHSKTATFSSPRLAIQEYDDEGNPRADGKAAHVADSGGFQRS